MIKQQRYDINNYYFDLCCTCVHCVWNGGAKRQK